jgi:hypothetical protein
MAINREKLRAIPDDKVLAMMRSGELELAYLHLFSLHNFRSMLDLAAEQPGAAPAAPESPDPAASEPGEGQIHTH